MKEKLEYMQKQFELEIDREESLNKKAQFYLSIISIILSTFVFKAKDLKEILDNESCTIPTFLILTTILLIFVSLLFITLSMKIHGYARSTTMSSVKKEMINKTSDTEFQKHRIADIIIAINKNSIINDSRARKLQLSMLFMIFSIALGCIFIISIII